MDNRDNHHGGLRRSANKVRQGVKVTQRSTLERALTIVAMLLGVVSFTFVVSNINSIISQNKKKNMQEAKSEIFLDQMQKKYNLSNDLICMAKSEVSKSMDTVNMENFKNMISSFPKNLRNELYLSMFRDRLSKINIFKMLPDEVIITLGKVLTPIIYMPSKMLI